MNRRTGNLQIVLTGAMVGIGLVAVALAIFTRLPIGSKFVRALRQGSERQSGARLTETGGYQPSQMVEWPKSAPAPPESNLAEIPGENESEGLPSSVTITSSTEISMGIGKIVLEIGNVLSVTGKENGVFLCDYLGDTVKVPVSVTDWGNSADPQVNHR